MKPHLGISGTVFALGLFVLAAPAAAQSGAGQTPLEQPESAKAGPPEEMTFTFPKAEEQVKEIKKAVAEKEKAGGGAGAKEKAILREAEELLKWSKKSAEQAAGLKKQAAKARNDAERQYLERRAADKQREAKRFANIITGDNKPSGRPADASALPGNKGGNSQGGSASAGQGGGANGEAGRDKFKFGGALEQLKEANKRSQEARTASSVEKVKERATEAFGEGRAGGGGVTLHVTATIDGVDPAAVSRAGVLDGRLTLVLRDGSKIRFPEMDLDHLAVALRAVQGGEGLVKGELVGDGREVVVVKTGKDRYGEVAWRKSNLSPAYGGASIGSTVALPIGPGLGLLSVPEPSKDRVTYYGPIAGNDVGRIMLLSDETIAALSSGFDGRRGQLLPPLWKPLTIRDAASGKDIELPPIKGFQTTLEMRARKRVALVDAYDKARKEGREPPKEDKGPKAPEGAPWWVSTVWYVWSPGEMRLAPSGDGSELEFTRATMQLTSWSELEGNVDEEVAALAATVTTNFDQIAKRFPVLEELRGLAKIMSAVRWLHMHKIPVDLDWARSRRLAEVDTPDQVTDITVWTSYSGRKPAFE